MSLGFMQIVDHTLGAPLARLLGAITPRPKFLGGAAPSEVPKRVIVSKFVGLGSVVLSLPMLETLKSRGIRIAFWTFGSQEELLKISGLVDEIWVVKPTARDFLPTLLRTAWRAFRYRADAFIDLEQTANFSALLARLSGAKLRVGFMCGKQARESLFTHLVALTAGRHMVENCAAMANAIGVTASFTPKVVDLNWPAKQALPMLAESAIAPWVPPVHEPYLSLATPEPTLASSRQLEYEVENSGPTSKLNSHSRRYIVLNPNTSDLGRALRMWPQSQWVELCLKLLEDPRNELCFTGVAAERGVNEGIIHQIVAQIDGVESRLHNLAGRTNLRQLLGLLRAAYLAVSVDSGVMHLAAWAGTPLIGLFGPETPALYGPRSVNAKAIWAGLPCSPCCTVATEKHTRCRDNQCMKRIPAEQVLFAGRALIEEIAARRRRESVA